MGATTGFAATHELTLQLGDPLIRGEALEIRNEGVTPRMEGDPVYEKFMLPTLTVKLGDPGVVVEVITGDPFQAITESPPCSVCRS